MKIIKKKATNVPCKFIKNLLNLKKKVKISSKVIEVYSIQKIHIAVDSENLKDNRILYKNCNCYEPNKQKWIWSWLHWTRGLGNWFKNLLLEVYPQENLPHLIKLID